MKKKKMLDVFSLADDSFVAEADPTNKERMSKKSRGFSFSSIIACACCLLLVLNLLIFVPFLTQDNTVDIPSDNSLNHTQNPPSDSDSEGVKGQTNLIVNENILNVLDNLLKGEADLAPDISDRFENDALEKVKDELEESKGELGDFSGSVDTDINDNQVSGVSEADIIKRSDKYIFYLSNRELNVYSIDKENSTLVGKLSLKGYIEDLTYYNSEPNDQTDEEEQVKEEIPDIIDTPLVSTGSVNWEMYLSKDYKTLTVIAAPKYKGLTLILTFDVSHAPTVEMIDKKIFSGNYISSRMVDGELILFTRYQVDSNYTREKPTSYMPFYNQNGEEHITNDLYYPQIIYSSSYVVLSRINESTGKIEENSAFLGYSDQLYVSQDNIYLTRERQITFPSTEIVRIEYSNERFLVKGISTVLGTVKDQYSLDEYNGILRIVTTVSGKFSDDGTAIDTSESASLYCIDISKMETVAKVECFAPWGEIVRSVRYEGNFAYVCTSTVVTMIDPVFFFDLSDLENITCTDTGTIDGYSSSLINFGNGIVVGIGYGDTTSTLKIEVYKELEDKVVPVASYVSLDTDFSLNYKSYYINREIGLIGLGTTVDSEDRYLLLYFDGTNLIPIINEQFSHSSVNSARGFYEDSYYYTVSDKEFCVTNIGDMETVSKQ